MKNKQAFTLIELLIVVLIIGILAAVALPQYKIAVAKARLRSLMPLVDALVTSQESYYLANGKYALRFDDIDINIPTPNSITASNGAWGEIAHYPHFDLQVISAGGRAYGMTQGISYGVVMDNYTSADFYTCKRLAYASVSSEFPNQIIRGLGGRKLLTANGQNYYCLPE